LNHCNLGCVYCVTGDEEVKAAGAAGKRAALSVPSLLEIIGRLHGQLQLGTIRLTGGEPLLYHGLVELIRGIRELGIPAIKLTTNGFLLERLALPMKEAGMTSVNVSLDAVDEDVFYQMSRRHSVARVIRGIDAAREAGMDVKINTVVMRGINDGQILPLLDFAFARHCRIRFLEVMAMGHLHDHPEEYLFSQKDILSVIEQRYHCKPLVRAGSATARYWQTDEGHSFGIIANETEPFCRDCDRLRLDSSGHIYGCLSSNHPIHLTVEENEIIWTEKLQEALLQKQPLRFTGSDLSMLHIGG
jgi:cyclic pyranopterin phosphate synthase